MIRHKAAFGLVGVALLAGGCVDAQRNGEIRMSNELCRKVGQITQDAKRDAFSLDYPAAERGFRQIVALYNDEPGLAECENPVTLPQAHMNLGLVLSNQRRYLLADVSFQTAERLLQGGSGAQVTGDRVQLGAYLQQHALNRNDTEGVRRHADATLALLNETRGESVAFVGDSDLFGVDAETQNRLISEAQTYYAQGYATFSEGSVDGVEELSNQAIDLVRPLPANGLQARFALQQALAQSAKGNWAAAAATAEAAARELEETLANSPLLARALLVQATALSFTANRDLAYRVYERAFDVYEEAPVGLNYEAVWPYIRFVTDGVARGELSAEEQAARIFRAGQLVRGSFTAYDIATAAATFEAGDSGQAEAVRDWREAENRLARLRGAQAQINRLLPEQVVELERQIAEASEREADLRARRDELAPGYADAINAPVSLDEVSASLAEGEVLVQILTGNPNSTVLAVDSSGAVVKSVQLPRGLLETLGLRNQEAFLNLIVAEMRRSFTAQDGRFPPFAVELSHILHGLLFDGIEEKLQGKQRVFVTTNGIMQSIPLDLLITENPAPLADSWRADDYRGLQWLGDKFELSYLPSARNLVDIRSRARQSAASNPVIAFGGFQANTTARSVLDRAGLPNECGDAAAAIANLPALPRSGDEVDSIAAALGGGSRRVTGIEFTEEAVLELAAEGALKDYQVLHFATHGLVWPIEDCFTEPALATSVGPGATTDGLLSSSEIRSMELDAQFVVLSACDTVGTGGDLGISGENLSGLARAFFSAGSRSVMASHWKVDDAITAEMMSDMYERLAAQPGTGFGEALRGARVAVRNSAQRSHPANWAAFVVIGDSTLGLVPRSGDS